MFMGVYCCCYTILPLRLHGDLASINLIQCNRSIILMGLGVVVAGKFLPQHRQPAPQ